MEPRPKRPDRKAKASSDQNKVLKLKKYFDDKKKKKSTSKPESKTQDETSKDTPENKPSSDLKFPPGETTSDDKNSAESSADVRPDSPEPNCAICLETLTNKSFTDSCFHTFCFTCLVEWSRVKPECPLCKQRFKSIVHNVQKDYTYDEYHIQAARPPNLWSFLSETTQRFRYPTTMTPLTILRRNLESLQDTYHSQIESHRRRFAPHAVGMFSDSSMIARAPPNFRNRVYSHDLWVMPNTSDRVRTVSPEFYRRNPACTHRLLPWLNRELVALLQNNETQVTFVLELIMALIARYEITSQEFFVHIEPYIGDKTRHFIHELYNFAISPHNMEAYDRWSNYSGPRGGNLEDDDDIRIESENISSRPKTTSTTSATVSRTTESTTEAAPAAPTKIVLKKKDENNWETVPLAFSAGSSSNPGPSTSAFADNADTLLSAAAVIDSDNEECQILEVLKPKRERTPEIVDLSSDDEVTRPRLNSPTQTQTLIEILSDDDTEYTVSGASSVDTDTELFSPWLLPRGRSPPRARYRPLWSPKESSPSRTQPPSEAPGSPDSDIEISYSSYGQNYGASVPVERPLSPVPITGANVEVALQALQEPNANPVEGPKPEPSTSNAEDSTKTEKEEEQPKKPKLLSAIVRPWEQAGRSTTDENRSRSSSSRSKSTDSKAHSRKSNDSSDSQRRRSKMKRRMPKSPVHYSSSSDDTDDASDGKEPVKKLKLRSVVAHFTFDSSGQKRESSQRSSSHKKRRHHKDKKRRREDKDKKSKKDKSRLKRLHRHKRRIYSDSSSSA